MDNLVGECIVFIMCCFLVIYGLIGIARKTNRYRTKSLGPLLFVRRRKRSRTRR